MRRSLNLLVLLLCIYFNTNAQEAEPKEVRAYKFAQEAVKLIDAGQAQKALFLLDSAIRLDSTVIHYKYEKSLAFYTLRKFDSAIVILDTLVNSPDASDQFYQMLSKCFFFKNDKDKSYEILKQGLQKFPRSGRLYYEVGNLGALSMRLKEVVQFWEMGIKADPRFPDNYYQLVKYYYNTPDRVWAILYAEVFLNLSRNKALIEEVSTLMFDCYKKSLVKTPTGEIELKMTSSPASPQKPIDTTNARFEDLFQRVLWWSAREHLPSDTNSITIEQIYEIRKDFIENWYRDRSRLPQIYKNVLFDRQKFINVRKYTDAYTYWMMKDGNKKEFEEWIAKNEKHYNSFLKWFQKNSIQIDEENFIYRMMYED